MIGGVAQTWTLPGLVFADDLVLLAERSREQAGISPLLDTEDMVLMKKPDWKCVFTYVQSLYRNLVNKD
ncbi:hypothetical protein MRX96_044033 [Rhipicephalus microplus]